MCMRVWMFPLCMCVTRAHCYVDQVLCPCVGACVDARMCVGAAVCARVRVIIAPAVGVSTMTCMRTLCGWVVCHMSVSCEHCASCVHCVDAHPCSTVPSGWYVTHS